VFPPETHRRRHRKTTASIFKVRKKNSLKNETELNFDYLKIELILCEFQGKKS
jgi:hypothetical protein